MDYLSGVQHYISNPTPFMNYPTNMTPYVDNSLDALLASIASPHSNIFNTQPSSMTLQCIPQTNVNIGNNTSVYQVPEDMPIDAILQKFGVDRYSLQPAGSMGNYNRISQVPYLPSASVIPSTYTPSSSSSSSRRFLLCQEVSERDLHQGSVNRNYPNNPSNPPPSNTHNVLSQVWQRTARANDQYPPNPSNSNFNYQQQPVSMQQRDAVDHVWQRAKDMTDPNIYRFSPGSPNNSLPPAALPLQSSGSRILYPPNVSQMGSPLSNAWNNTNYPPRQSSPPPMMNTPWNRSPPPLSQPIGGLQRSPSLRLLPPAPSQIPPPPSLSSLLAQAYRQRSPHPYFM